MSSQKKLDSNRRNSKFSTGPKTQAGKKHARINALKHGFYAKEMIINQKYEMDVDKLHLDIFSQLRPRTVLQEIAFKEIAFCAWRCEIAARLEMRRLNAQLEPADKEQPPPEIREKPTILGWFASSPQDLRNGLRFLEFLKTEVHQRGEVSAERQEEVTRCFGPEFWGLLKRSKSSLSLDEILLAHHLTEHAATFKKPLPPIDNNGQHVIVDPEQQMRAVICLLELEQQFLETIQFMNRASRDPAAEGSGDESSRHFASATRALHQAVDWYQHLVETKL